MPTKIIAFSDHHAHNFAYGAERVDGLVARRYGYYNSRFLYSLKVLKEIEDAAKGSNCVLFGGDLFHQRGAVSTEVMMGTYAAIEHLKEYVPKLVMIPGNHDYADRSGTIHSLMGLSGSDEIVEDSSYSFTWLDKNIGIWTIPYQEDKAKFLEVLSNIKRDLNEFKAKFNILLAHQGIQGSLVGSDYVLTSQHDISVTDIPDWFDLCLFGHYHKHQKVKDNVYYIGATHHHNWGDANEVRGYLNITINDDFTYTLEQVETHSAPKFIITDKAIKCRPIDFVKSTNDKLTSKDLGNPKVFENIEVNHEQDEPKEFVVPTHSVDDILKSWCTLHDKPEFLELGKSIIKDV